jgi:hypothetical protein
MGVPYLSFSLLVCQDRSPWQCKQMHMPQTPHHITTHALQGVVTHDDIIVIIDGEAGAAAAVAINK